MGFGDIALIAMVGAFLGLKLTLFVLFTAPLLGTTFAVAMLIRHSRGGTALAETHRRSTTAELLRTGHIPFGVFLGACSLIAVFCGEAAWSRYIAWIAS